MEKTRNSDYWCDYGVHVFMTFEKAIKGVLPGFVRFIFFIMCMLSISGAPFPLFASKVPLNAAYAISGVFIVAGTIYMLYAISVSKMYLGFLMYRATHHNGSIPADTNETIWNIMLILRSMKSMYRWGSTVFLGFTFYNMILLNNFLPSWIGNTEYLNILLIFELMYIPIWMTFKIGVLNPALHFGLHMLPVTRKVKDDMAEYIISVILGGGVLAERSSLNIPMLGICFDESGTHRMRSIECPFYYDNRKTSKSVSDMAKYYNYHSDTGLYYVTGDAEGAITYDKDEFETFFKGDSHPSILTYIVTRRIACGVYNKFLDTLSKRYFPVEVNDKILDVVMENMAGIAYPSDKVPSSIIDKINSRIDMYSYSDGKMKETVILKKDSPYHDSIEETIEKNGFIKV